MLTSASHIYKNVLITQYWVNFKLTFSFVAPYSSHPTPPPDTLVSVLDLQPLAEVIQAETKSLHVL